MPPPARRLEQKPTEKTESRTVRLLPYLRSLLFKTDWIQICAHLRLKKLGVLGGQKLSYSLAPFRANPQSEIRNPRSKATTAVALSSSARLGGLGCSPIRVRDAHNPRRCAKYPPPNIAHLRVPTGFLRRLRAAGALRATRRSTSAPLSRFVWQPMAAARDPRRFLHRHLATYHHRLATYHHRLATYGTSHQLSRDPVEALRTYDSTRRPNSRITPANTATWSGRIIHTETPRPTSSVPNSVDTVPTTAAYTICV